eukprot:1376794-Rhodomonas_salina.2
MSLDHSQFAPATGRTRAEASNPWPVQLELEPEASAADSVFARHDDRQSARSRTETGWRLQAGLPVHPPNLASARPEKRETQRRLVPGPSRPEGSRRNQVWDHDLDAEHDREERHAFNCNHAGHHGDDHDPPEMAIKTIRTAEASHWQGYLPVTANPSSEPGIPKARGIEHVQADAEVRALSWNELLMQARRKGGEEERREQERREDSEESRDEARWDEERRDEETRRWEEDRGEDRRDDASNGGDSEGRAFEREGEEGRRGERETEREEEQERRVPREEREVCSRGAAGAVGAVGTVPVDVWDSVEMGDWYHEGVMLRSSSMHSGMKRSDLGAEIRDDLEIQHEARSEVRRRSRDGIVASVPEGNEDLGDRNGQPLDVRNEGAGYPNDPKHADDGRSSFDSEKGSELSLIHI